MTNAIVLIENEELGFPFCAKINVFLQCVWPSKPRPGQYFSWLGRGRAGGVGVGAIIFILSDLVIG